MVTATAFLLAGISFTGHAQSLSFCQKLDASGNPANPSTEFTVGKNGGPVLFYFVPPQSFASASVNFDVYTLQEGKEVFKVTLKQSASGSKAVAKQMTFYDAGRYRIYVFDDKDKQLAKGELTIKHTE